MKHFSFQSLLWLCAFAIVGAASTVSAQELGAYDKLDEDETWTGLTLVVDYGIHSGIKPGGSFTASNGAGYDKIEDGSLNMRMGLVSWPARAPFSEGATVFGQSVGFALELWGGIYSLFGGGASEDTSLRGGLTVDILYPLIQATNFGVMATFQGGVKGDPNLSGLMFGPGLQGLFQMNAVRVIGEYRFLPFWIGNNLIAHDMRLRLQLQMDDTFFLGLFTNLNLTQLREPEGGYTARAVSIGLEMGF